MLTESLAAVWGIPIPTMVGIRAQHAGASVVFPIQEFCGERMARLRDPFGHLWILSQRIEELSTEEKQRRRDALLAQFALRGNARDRSSDVSKHE